MREGRRGANGLGRTLSLGGMEVFVVGVNRVADGTAPAIGAENVVVFVFGEPEALGHDLSDEGEGRGGFGLDVTAGGSGEDAAKSGVEIAGREVLAGKNIVDFAADIFGGLGLLLPLGMGTAEQRMAGLARRAAAAAIGESESTQRRRTIRHGSLLRVGFSLLG
jgi:hypothetical protein